jgi:hypothetical protein
MIFIKYNKFYQINAIRKEEDKFKGASISYAQ